MDQHSRRNSLASTATATSTASYSTKGAAPVSVRNLNTDQLLSIDQRFIKKSMKPAAADYVPQKARGTYYFPNGEVFRPRSSPSRRNRPLKLTPGPRANSLTQVAPPQQQARYPVAPYHQFPQRSNPPEQPGGPPRSYSLSSLKRPQDLAHTLRGSRNDTPTNIEPQYHQNYYAQIVVPKQQYYQPYQGAPPIIKSNSVVSLVHSSPSDSPRNTNTTLSDSNLSSLSNYNLNRSSSNTPQTSISNSLEEEPCDPHHDFSAETASVSGDNLSTLREVEEAGLNKSGSLRSNFDQLSTPIVSDSEDGDDEKEIEDDEGIVMSTPTRQVTQATKASPAKSARSTYSDAATRIVDSYHDNSSLYSSEHSFRSSNGSPHLKTSELVAHFDVEQQHSTSTSPKQTQQLLSPPSSASGLSPLAHPPLSPQKVFEFRTNDKIVQRLINDPEVPTRGDIQINDNHTKIIRLQNAGSSPISCQTVRSNAYPAMDERLHSADNSPTNRSPADDTKSLGSAHPSPTIAYSEFHEANEEVSTEPLTHEQVPNDKPLPTTPKSVVVVSSALPATNLSETSSSETFMSPDEQEDEFRNKNQVAMNTHKNSAATLNGLEPAYAVQSESDSGSSLKKSKLQRKPPLHREPSFPRHTAAPMPQVNVSSAQPFLAKTMTPISREGESPQESVSPPSIDADSEVKNVSHNSPKEDELLKDDTTVSQEHMSTEITHVAGPPSEPAKPKSMSYKAMMEALSKPKQPSTVPKSTSWSEDKKPIAKETVSSQDATTAKAGTWQMNTSAGLKKAIKPAKSLPSFNQNKVKEKKDKDPKEKEKKSRWNMFKKASAGKTPPQDSLPRYSTETTDGRSMTSHATSTGKFKISARSFSFGNLRHQFKKEEAPPLPTVLPTANHEALSVEQAENDIDSFVTKELTLTKLPTIETEDNMLDDLMETFDEELQKLGRRSVYKPMNFTEMRKNDGPFLKDDELTNDQIEDQRKNDDSTPGKHQRSASDEYVDENLTFLKEEIIWPIDYDLESIKSDQRAVSTMLDLLETEEADESFYVFDKQQLINLFDSLDDQQRRRLPMHLKYIKQFKNYEKVEIKVKRFEPVLEKAVANNTNTLTPIIRQTSKSKGDKKVGFSHKIFINETFSPEVYSRYNKSVTQYTLTEPAEISRMKNEVNTFKCNEMLVHEQSQHNTHFFY